MKSPLEDTLHAFIEAQHKTNQKFELVMTQLVEENKEIKSHFLKLTNALVIQEKGKIPSQALSNPKGQQVAQISKPSTQIISEVNAITTVIDTLVDKEDELKVLNSSFLKISDSCEISIKPPTYEDSQDKKLEFWQSRFKKPPP